MDLRGMFLSACIFLMQELFMCETNTPDNNVDSPTLYGGDIVLSEEQRLDLTRADGDHGRRARAVVTVGTKKWVDGVVPYTLSPELNDSAVSAILAAMDQIEVDSDNCVSFRTRSPFHQDYLYIFPGDGCYSNIGRQGGAQNLSIGYKCESKGVIMHELIHALGRWHEQSRPDRAHYVRINRGNIEEGFESNFDIVEDGESSTQGLSYDYDSIMHYDAYAFSANDWPTIEPLDSDIDLNRLGQRGGLSEIDKQHINILYPMKYGQWSRWSSWSDCSPSCGSGFQQRTRQCLGGGKPCQGVSAEQRPCTAAACPTEKPQQWGAWSSWGGCSRSCGGGLRVRLRSCRVGNTCEGEDMEKQNCNVEKCPEVAEWSSWGSWSPCSVSCGGGGRSQRSRKCILKSSNTVEESEAYGHLCSGRALQIRACSTNISCGDTASLQGRACSTCYEDTCLTGLVLVGCFHSPLPTDSTTPTSLSTLRGDQSRAVDDSTAKAHLLKDCGKYAQVENYSFFSLKAELCYRSSSLADMVQSGSESCGARCKDCMEVYQITNQENFEHSVTAFESCGPDYCVAGLEGGSAERELSCSGSEWSANHLTFSIQVILVLLWTLFC